MPFPLPKGEGQGEGKADMQFQSSFSFAWDSIKLAQAGLVETGNDFWPALWQHLAVARHQIHRGLASKDGQLFSDKQLPVLRAASADLCWLLDRGYAARSALDLVGNRHNLTSRQRNGVARYACSLEDVQRREQRRVEPSELKGRELWLDGFNVLTMLESALAGGIVILGRDGCCRDIAGIHRRYRKMSETVSALCMVGETAAAWGVTCCRWWLDKPVSNSGRLKTLILENATSAGWKMEAELTFSPDHVLSHTDQIIATSDGIVLDRCQRWVNLVRLIIAERVPRARLLQLGIESAPRLDSGRQIAQNSFP
jgi:hypothetical protein